MTFRIALDSLDWTGTNSQKGSGEMDIHQPQRHGLADYFRNHVHPGGIIVSERYKFIYMKPTKTAGTSIFRAGLVKRVPDLIYHKDYPAKFYDWLERLSDEILADYFIFAVVRNPWDRLVSVATSFNLSFKHFAHHLEEYWQDDNLKMHSLPLQLYTHLDGQPFVDLFAGLKACSPI